MIKCLFMYYFMCYPFLKYKKSHEFHATTECVRENIRKKITITHLFPFYVLSIATRVFRELNSLARDNA